MRLLLCSYPLGPPLHGVKLTGGSSQVSVQSALDNGGASYLNGARLSTPSSLIVDTNVMGRGTMPEINTVDRNHDYG